MSLGEYIGAGSGITKGLWHLNGNSTDSSGNSRNGTDTDITYSLANGKFGQGAGFNGSTSKIVLASSSILNPAEVTSMAWALLNSGSGYILGKGTISNGCLTLKYSTTSITIDKSFIVQIGQAAGLTISTGVWHHIGVTYSQTSGAFVFYLNGSVVGSGTNKQTLSTVAKAIGSNNTDTSQKHNGCIDEVIIESGIWTPTQFKKYYTYAKGRFGI